MSSLMKIVSYAFIVSIGSSQAIAGPKTVTDALNLLDKAGGIVERSNGAVAVMNATTNTVNGAVGINSVASGNRPAAAEYKDTVKSAISAPFEIYDAAHAVTGKEDPLGPAVSAARKPIVETFSQGMYNDYASKRDADTMTNPNATYEQRQRVIENDGKRAAENRDWKANVYDKLNEDAGPSGFESVANGTRKALDYAKTAAVQVGDAAVALERGIQQTRCGSEGCNSFSDFFGIGRGGEIIMPKSEGDVASNNATQQRGIDLMPQSEADLKRARDQLTDHNYQRQQNNAAANAQTQALLNNILGLGLGLGVGGGSSCGGGSGMYGPAINTPNPGYVGGRGC